MNLCLDLPEVRMIVPHPNALDSASPSVVYMLWGRLDFLARMDTLYLRRSIWRKDRNEADRMSVVFRQTGLSGTAHGFDHAEMLRLNLKDFSTRKRLIVFGRNEKNEIESPTDEQIGTIVVVCAEFGIDYIILGVE